MALEDVEAIIKKAISDEAFKLALSKNFDLAITNHSLELTEEEKNALKKVDWTKKIPSDIDLTAAATWIHIYKTSAEL